MNAISDDRVKNELNRLVNLFKSEELPSICSRAFILNGNKPSSKWSLSNKLIMMIEGTVDARGFRQWNDVNRYVKKGTHAIYILAPRMMTVKDVDKETNKETTKQILNGWLAVPVFKYEDTDGQPLPEIQPKQLPELMTVAGKIGVKVEYREYNGSARFAYYSPNQKQIVLYTHETSTFYHELTHAVQEHLDGKQTVSKDSEEYKLNEVIAELTSAVIANLYGAKVDAQAYSYIKYYAKMLEQNSAGTDNVKVFKSIMRVIGKVEKMLNFIFSIEDKNQKEQA